MEPRHGIREVVAPEEPTSHEVDDGRTCIAVIGIDRYRAWSPLHNAVNDARGALNLFLQLGFEQVCAPLFDEAATGAALRSLVTDDLAVLGPNDSLVLFFAGHGHTVTRTYPGETSVKKGYIIPVDGDLPSGRTGTWLRLDSWLSDVAHLPVRHLLMVLDACHSGIALAPAVRWRGKEVSFAGSLGQLRTRRSRRIITSALDDELAMDSGPVPGHSLFTGCLIEGLTGGIVARTHESMVTGTEIGRYIQRRVIDYPNSKQTPDFGALELDDRGELVVRLAVPAALDTTFERVPPLPAPAAPAISNVVVDFEQLAGMVSPSLSFDSMPAAAKPAKPIAQRSPRHTLKMITVRNGTLRRALRSLAFVAAVGLAAFTLAIVVSRLLIAPSVSGRDAGITGVPSDAPRDASPNAFPDAPRETSPDARPNAITLAAVIAKMNPFLPLGGLHIQAHQVTRGEYSAYIATLHPGPYKGAIPLNEWDDTQPDEPVRWTRFEQATAFCAALDARLPTFDEWQRASGGKWGLDPAGDDHVGPLREWTSETVGNFVRVAGAAAVMNTRQRAQALAEKFQLATASAFAKQATPDADDVSSKEVGIRCVR